MILPGQLSLFYHPLLPLAHAQICTPRLLRGELALKPRRQSLITVPTHAKWQLEKWQRAWPNSMHICAKAVLSFLHFLIEKENKQRGEHKTSQGSAVALRHLLQGRHFIIIICYVSNIYVNVTFYYQDIHACLMWKWNSSHMPATSTFQGKQILQ